MKRASRKLALLVVILDRPLQSQMAYDAKLRADKAAIKVTVTNALESAGSRGVSWSDLIEKARRRKLIDVEREDLEDYVGEALASLMSRGKVKAKNRVYVLGGGEKNQLSSTEVGSSQAPRRPPEE